MPAIQEQGRLEQKRWSMNRVAGERNAEIRIYSDIGYWYGSQMFLEQLDALGDVAVLDVRINSYGGVASEGIAIYNALASHPATKRVWVDAAAYSIASVIMLAASPGELRVADNARIMIHNAWNYAEGDKRELRKVADILDLLDGTIATTYAKRMKAKSKDEILALMDEESWFDAEQAKAIGLADEVFDAAGTVEDTEDSLNLLREFKRLPADLAQRLGVRRGTATPSATGEASQATAIEVAARWAAVRERNAA